MQAFIDRQKLSDSFAGLLVIAVLGANLWVTLLLVPVGHARTSPNFQANFPLWLLGLPPVFLLAGLLCFSRVTLLALFPTSLALLAAAFRGPTGQAIFSLWTFGVAALSLLGYLVGTTMFLEVQAQKDEAVSRRRLDLPPLSPKWRRRRRVYWMLAIFAALLPLTFIYTIDFHPPTAAALRLEYEAGAAEMQTLLVVAMLGLWLWLFATFFVTPLEEHRRGDRELRAGLRQQRDKHKHAHPRLGFYLSVTTTLGLMGVLLWLRGRYG